MTVARNEKRIGRRWVVAAVLAGASVAATVLSAPSAAALGDNRVVSRSCGTNYVASGYNVGTYWAETQRNSGHCKGRLSVALQLNNGARTARIYGTSEAAYTTYRNRFLSASHGLHWGCDNCNVTFS